MAKLIDRVGDKYGMLVVLRRAGIINATASWLCRCDCGTEIEISSRHLGKKNGKTSCGCAGSRFPVRTDADGIRWSMQGGGYYRTRMPLCPLANATGEVYEHEYRFWEANGKVDWVLRLKQEGASIHHVSGDRTDNRPENLEIRFRHPSGITLDDMEKTLRLAGRWPEKDER